MKFPSGFLKEWLFGTGTYFLPWKLANEEQLTEFVDEIRETYDYGVVVPLVGPFGFPLRRILEKYVFKNGMSFRQQYTLGLGMVAFQKTVQAAIRPYIPDIIEPENITGEYVYNSLLSFLQSETARDLIRTAVVSPLAWLGYRKLKDRAIKNSEDK